MARWVIGGDSSLPLADRGKPWDAAAAEKRVRAWAGKDTAKYGRAFVTHDAEKPELLQSYRLPFADIIDGKLAAIPRGLFTVAAVMQGARGGVALPAEYRDKAKAFVAAYYKRMDLAPPWKSDGDMEYKAAPTEIQVKQDGDTLSFTGYASTWSQDQVGDVIVPGAFAKTIAERGPTTAGGALRSQIKVLWQHDLRLPIGLPTLLAEDEKGLKFEARLSDTQLARDAHRLMKDGTVDAMSIGYRVVRHEYDSENDVRLLHEIKLFEFSPVTFPANEAARVTSVKAQVELEIADLWSVLAELCRVGDAAGLQEKFSNALNEDEYEFLSRSLAAPAQEKATRMREFLEGMKARNEALRGLGSRRPA